MGERPDKASESGVTREEAKAIFEKVLHVQGLLENASSCLQTPNHDGGGKESFAILASPPNLSRILGYLVADEQRIRKPSYSPIAKKIATTPELQPLSQVFTNESSCRLKDSLILSIVANKTYATAREYVSFLNSAKSLLDRSGSLPVTRDAQSSFTEYLDLLRKTLAKDCVRFPYDALKNAFCVFRDHLIAERIISESMIEEMWRHPTCPLGITRRECANEKSCVAKLAGIIEDFWGSLTINAEIDSEYFYHTYASLGTSMVECGMDAAGLAEIFKPIAWEDGGDIIYISEDVLHFYERVYVSLQHLVLDRAKPLISVTEDESAIPPNVRPDIKTAPYVVWSSDNENACPKATPCTLEQVEMLRSNRAEYALFIDQERNEVLVRGGSGSSKPIGLTGGQWEATVFLLANRGNWKTVEDIFKRTSHDGSGSGLTALTDHKGEPRTAEMGKSVSDCIGKVRSVFRASELTDYDIPARVKGCHSILGKFTFCLILRRDYTELYELLP